MNVVSSLQVLCLAEFVQFTERCEEAIKTRGLQEFLMEVEQQLESYTTVDITSAGEADADVAVLDLKLKALILDTIHNMDVVQVLIDTKTKSTDEWMWQKQLRYRQTKI